MIDLFKNNEKYYFFDFIPIGICIIDKDFIVRFWNYCLEDWTDLARKDIVGTCLLDNYPKLGENKYRTLIDGIFNGGPPVIFSSQLHKNIFPPIFNTSVERIQHVTLSSMWDSAATEFLALFSVEDVTDLNNNIKDYRKMRDQALDEIENRKKIEEELIKHKTQLLQLNATKDKFFSIMAHDLKNPISTFISVTKLLQELFDDLSKEEVQDFIKDINESSMKLFNLLDNLLTWSRSQTGRIEVNSNRINLWDIAETSITMLRMNALNKKIEISSEIHESTEVYADSNMISTVFRNLISNSIKFTPIGGKINLYAKEDTDFVQITIEDTGLGISEDDINKLFRIDIHHTTIGTSSEKGTGLGLILCKEFIEKNSGKIWVESELGKGSKFIIQLPK